MFERTLMNVLTASEPETDPLYVEHTKQAAKTSYQTYFNAFPASYWQNSTKLESITLQLEITGSVTAKIYKSNHLGEKQLISQHNIDDNTQSVELPLTGFKQGGFYWFDLEARSTKFELISGSWKTDREPVREPRLSIGITTFNKPEYCVENLKNIASDQELLKNLDTIYLVDQGTKLVENEPGIEYLLTILGTKLRIIQQENLGGSGGFSRSMYEALNADLSDQLLLLDDDVKIQTESIKRALAFASYTTKPTIVGGHMFDINYPTVLHAFSELVDEVSFLWTQREKDQYRHNFEKKPLSATPWLHQYMPADYNGWWMCMIPLEIIKEIGLGLPFFIKWDDAEYGLRAKTAGYQTISLPGVALWHVSWLDKDDAQDWQAYFHVKNRFITALLHSDAPGGGTLVRESKKHTLKRLLALQYYAVRLSNNALKDIMDTSTDLHEVLGQVMPEARDIANQFSETIKHPPQSKPETKQGKLHFTDFDEGRPSGTKLALWLVLNAPRHFYKNSRKTELPYVEFPKLQATWWRVAKYDSYLVEASAMDGYFWFSRDSKLFSELLKESHKLHNELTNLWDELQKSYRSQLPVLTGAERWGNLFDEVTKSADTVLLAKLNQ